MAFYARFCVTSDDLRDITPIKARDLIVHCFFEAQKETFSRAMKTMGQVPTDADLKRNLEASVRVAFREAGGDFDHPDLPSLMGTVQALGNKAAVMGTPPDIIAHHQAEIMKVFGALGVKK
jgi:hypothetical protein